MSLGEMLLGETLLGETSLGETLCNTNINIKTIGSFDF
jgi:hypothetical protein